MTSSSNSSQSTCLTGQMLGKNYSSFLDFTRNYEQTSGIFVPCVTMIKCLWIFFLYHPVFQSIFRWHAFNTEVQSCQHERMVPATIAHRKDLIKNIEGLKPGGTSELE